MGKPKETLSTEGVITSVEAKLEKLMLGFFLANSTQLKYIRSVKPLPYLVAMYEQSPAELRSNIDQNLREHLTPLFDSVDLTVSYNINESTNNYDITIDGNVVEDSISYRIGYTLITSGKTIVSLFDAINGVPLEVTFPIY